MIHQYRNSGLNIVMDIESGSVHVVDDIVYDMVHALDAMDKTSVFRKVSEGEFSAVTYDEIAGYLSFMLPGYSEDDIKEAYGEVSELIEAGSLFTDDVYKDFVMDFKKRVTVVKALCLHIAHDCNLACQYCFAEEG